MIDLIFRVPYQILQFNRVFYIVNEHFKKNHSRYRKFNQNSILIKIDNCELKTEVATLSYRFLVERSSGSLVLY